ncbi:MAG: DUF1707 SHOCT-like domain-containing protein [Mycobacteriales bacterium]
MEEVARTPGWMRAGDADREAVIELLRAAVGAGYLSIDEFAERATRVWAATTWAELRAITADLPARQPIVAPMPTRPRPRYDIGPAVLRVLTTIWVAGGAVNVVVWALVCIGRLGWYYPWWIWVLVPPGSALFVLWRTVGEPQATA